MQEVQEEKETDSQKNKNTSPKVLTLPRNALHLPDLRKIHTIFIFPATKGATDPRPRRREGAAEGAGGGRGEDGNHVFCERRHIRGVERVEAGWCVCM